MLGPPVRDVFTSDELLVVPPLVPALAMDGLLVAGLSAIRSLSLLPLVTELTVGSLVLPAANASALLMRLRLARLSVVA